jgi:CHAT domain-containing protein
MDPYLVFKERSRVLDMLAVQTELQLVVFSACMSGMGHASESGDMRGFSHAVLAAGANAYLGALWDKNDVSAMIYMYYFYLILFVTLDAPSLAEAWQFVTKMLYDLTIGQAVKLLEQFIQHWDMWEERGEKPNEFVKNGRRKLVVVI